MISLNKPLSYECTGETGQVKLIRMDDLLYIIDTFSLMFQVFHAIAEMTGPSGQPTNAVFGFTRRSATDPHPEKRPRT